MLSLLSFVFKEIVCLIVCFPLAIVWLILTEWKWTLMIMFVIATSGTILALSAGLAICLACVQFGLEVLALWLGNAFLLWFALTYQRRCDWEEARLMSRSKSS